MHFTIANYRTVGLRSGPNQDSLMVNHIRIRGREEIFVGVADGIGSLDLGEETSGYVLNRLSDWYYDECKSLMLEKEAFEMIQLSLQHELDSIQKQLVVFERNHMCNSGTTLTALMTYRNEYLIIHVGDSSCILLKKLTILKKIKRIFTGEKSFLDINKCTYDTVNEKGNLTACIGMAGEDEPYFFTGQLKKDTMWLLATDGILFNKNMKNIDRGFRLFPKLEKTNIEDKLEALAERATGLGSKDNMAAVAVIIS